MDTLGNPRQYPNKWAILVVVEDHMEGEVYRSELPFDTQEEAERELARMRGQPGQAYRRVVPPVS